MRLNRMIRDSGQHVPQITFGIDSVLFCCTEQTVNRRGTMQPSRDTQASPTATATATR
jgi:hypothetical protein